MASITALFNQKHSLNMCILRDNAGHVLDRYIYYCYAI